MVQVALQNDGSGQGIPPGLGLRPPVAGAGQAALGLDGGQTLVPVFDRQRQASGKLSAEGLDRLGLRAKGAVQRNGQADHDDLRLLLLHETSDGIEVGGQLLALYHRDGQGNSRPLVGDGNADAPLTHIQTNDTHDS